MKIIYICCLFAFMLTSATAAKDGWELIWYDEFDGNSINTTKWQHEVDCWGNFYPRNTSV